MKEKKKWKYRIIMIGGMFVLCSIGILTWYRKDNLLKTEYKIPETKFWEETTKPSLSLPTLEEKIKPYQIEMERENEEQNKIILEESLESKEIRETEENAKLQEEWKEKPTVIINGEESSFISKGKIDENGNVEAIKPSAETVDLEKIKTFSQTQEDIAVTEKESIDSGNTEWENLWKGVSGTGKENTAQEENILDFQLSGEHTGY